LEGGLQSQLVRCEHARGAPEHVARPLIEHDHRSEQAAGLGAPLPQTASQQDRVQRAEALSQATVELRILLPPAPTVLLVRPPRAVELPKPVVENVFVAG